MEIRCQDDVDNKIFKKTKVNYQSSGPHKRAINAADGTLSEAAQMVVGQLMQRPRQRSLRSGAENVCPKNHSEPRAVYVHPFQVREIK